MYKSATVLRVCGNFLITHLGFIIPTIKARNDKMKIRVNNIALMFEKYNYRTLETNNKSDLKNHLDLFEFEKVSSILFLAEWGYIYYSQILPARKDNNHLFEELQIPKSLLM